jgi:hypothetical protein
METYSYLKPISGPEIKPLFDPRIFHIDQAANVVLKINLTHNSWPLNGIIKIFLVSLVKNNKGTIDVF